MSKKETKHLDCTLRDGGYYNNWDFSEELVNDYLNAMKSINVDVVELGFRSFPSKNFKGPYYYTTSKVFKSIDLPEGLDFGVMINASEIIDESDGPVEQIKKLFDEDDKKFITLVRIACHYKEVEKILDATIWLKEQGYKVGLNLMQISNKTETEITEITKKINEYDIDILYFADSLGNLEPSDVEKLYKIFKTCWDGEIGIHTHDNLGNGMANSIKSMDLGIEWIDTTVTGMGRGPGNAQTEYMAIELANRSHKKNNLIPLFKTIEDHFKPMQIHYGWGKNPFYYLAGKNEIHPMFLQKILSDLRFDTSDALSLIDYLKDQDSTSFDSTIFERDWESDGNNKGDFDPGVMVEGKDILILAHGSSLERYKSIVEKEIKDKGFFVIALNTQEVIENKLINLRAACHPLRIVADLGKYKSLQQKIIMPVGRLSEDLKRYIEEVSCLDFGMSIKKDCFEFNKTSCVIPSKLAIAYCLGFITSGNAKSVSIAGFDGYGNGNPRNNETDNIFKIFHESQNKLKITSLTPTEYNIDVDCIF